MTLLIFIGLGFIVYKISTGLTSSDLDVTNTKELVFTLPQEEKIIDIFTLNEKEIGLYTKQHNQEQFVIIDTTTGTPLRKIKIKRESIINN